MDDDILSKVRNVKLVMLDLDGTLFFKGDLISGAIDAVEYLKMKGVHIRFMTNIDSESPETIINKVRKMGLDIDPSEFFSPVAAVEKFICANEDKSFRFIVSDDVMDYLGNIKENTIDNPDYVVIGDFRELINYDILNSVFRNIMDGAEILCLQKGKYFFNSDGMNLDTGAFVNMFEFSSGKEAIIFGKPSKDFFNLAMKECGVEPHESVIIGDDMETDIEGAVNSGAFSILVKTGKFRAFDIEGKNIHPDFIIDSIRNIDEII